MAASSIMNTYGERSTTLVKGEGVYLWDADGKRYLDAIAGIAVCGLGYSHPAVSEALCQQARTLIHCSNLYSNQPQQLLGQRLVALAGMDKVFLSNSGAEANEAALKIARKYGQDRGISAPEVITADKSFHGRTMATLSATGNAKIQAGFAPLVAGFVHAPYNDVNAIRAAATANTVAVMVEPIQGEGGVNVPADSYLAELRALCDAEGWLLILDEIQTGNGRTGTYFACEQAGIVPDVLTTAKGLGNGVPIGACLARGKAAEVLQPGNHGSTFGGNPLASQTALTVIDTLISGNHLANAAVQGRAMLEAFKTAFATNLAVSEVRGKGLMIGIELDRDCGELVALAKEQGLLVNVTAGNTVRLLPPLIITDAQRREIVDTVVSLITTFCA